MPVTTDPGLLDFRELIAERTRHFTGREWVFERVSDWLGETAGARVFLLSGGPGTGKTAIAARIAQMSLGQAAAYGRVVPGVLAYHHFCQAGRDSTLAPLGFVQSLSSALATRYPGFHDALQAQHSSQIVINAPVNVAGDIAPGAAVAGANIQQINIEFRGGDARAMFDEAVRRPLLALCGPAWSEPIVVLVDSLDEALSFSADASIVHQLRLLGDFPSQVRFLLTSRPNNPRILELVGAVPRVDLIADAPGGVEAEVATYARARLGSLPEPERATLAATVASKSRGNFLYAYHVLNELAESPPGAARGDLDELPDGLDEVYRGWLVRAGADSQSPLWRDVYRPLLGLTAVARGDGLTQAQLAGITGLGRARIDDALAACRQYLVGGEPPGRPYRIYHQSFRDFLLTDEAFGVYPAEQHANIAKWLLQLHGRSWGKCEDEYALRYTPLHLAEALTAGSDDADGGAADDASRLEQIRSLVELATHPRYQQRCEQALRDLPMLHEHVARAVAAAAASDRDEALPWLVHAALGLASFRREFLRGDPVIELAREGLLEQAEARLPLFADLDSDWRIAASLILAWLALERNRGAAVQLRDRVAALAPQKEPLPLLLARLDAAIAGAAAFPAESLPSADLCIGQQIVRRMSGQQFDREMLAANMNVLAPLGLLAEMIEHDGYSAAADAPVLVGMALGHGPDGTALLDEYVAAHGGYNYVQYRNRSLWLVLHAVLRHHPDSAWVRDRLQRILAAAAAGGGAEFTEMTPLTAALLQQRSPSTARALLDTQGTATCAAVQRLESRRGANDAWSQHKRRLTMLMEMEALVLGDRQRAQGVYGLVLELEGRRVLEGFAGFQAPAELRLADAMRACGIGDPQALAARLERARSCAHHVQDYHFCARTTARCNALQRWHAAELDATALEAVIERLALSPAAREFAADHVVGERYEHRGPDDDPQKLPIWPAREAGTLERLADVFQRPVVEWRRLNPEFSLSAPIAPGTRVDVPDPGFAPLLASHLAARVVADVPSGPRRARLLRRLVPVAAASATTLDSVLACLLIAAAPEDDGILADIVREAGPVVQVQVDAPRGDVGPDSLGPDMPAPIPA